MKASYRPKPTLMLPGPRLFFDSAHSCKPSWHCQAEAAPTSKIKILTSCDPTPSVRSPGLASLSNQYFRSRRAQVQPPARLVLAIWKRRSTLSGSQVKHAKHVKHVLSNCPWICSESSLTKDLAGNLCFRRVAGGHRRHDYT